MPQPSAIDRGIPTTTARSKYINGTRNYTPIKLTGSTEAELGYHDRKRFFFRRSATLLGRPLIGKDETHRVLHGRVTAICPELHYTTVG